MSETTSHRSAERQSRRNAPRRTAPALLAVKAPKMVQVRLGGDEVARLTHSMEVLRISSTSDALREGIRLLAREASEAEAAAQIRDYYQGEPAPLPEGVAPLDEADLLAADDAEW